MDFIYKYGKHGKLRGAEENLEKVVERRSFDSCWKQCFFCVCKLSSKFPGKL